MIYQTSNNYDKKTPFALITLNFPLFLTSPCLLVFVKLMDIQWFKQNIICVMIILIGFRNKNPKWGGFTLSFVFLPMVCSLIIHCIKKCGNISQEHEMNKNLFNVSDMLITSFHFNRPCTHPTNKAPNGKISDFGETLVDWLTKGRTNLEMGKQTLSSDNCVGWAKSWANKNKATEKMLSLIIGRTHSLFPEL